MLKKTKKPSNLHILKQYGLKIPISKVRSLAGTDKQGTSIYGIIKASESLGFSSRGVKGNHEAFFSGFPLPAIAHVITEEGIYHYVVLHKITKKVLLLLILQKESLSIPQRIFLDFGQVQLFYFFHHQSFQKVIKIDQYCLVL